MTAEPTTFNQFEDRLTAALRHVYPRLLVHIDRLITARRVFGLEACDVCQESVLAAVLQVKEVQAHRDVLLEPDAICALIFSVAARVAHGKLVDFLRWSDRRRRQQALAPPDLGIDGGVEGRQQARDALSSLLRQAQGSERRALELVLEMGEIDPAVIADRTRLSRPYVYRLLQRLACQSRLDEDRP